MKKILPFLNKIVSLSCFIALVQLNSSLFAQIIYTDIQDATPSVSFPLDLNNDQIDDFRIQFEALDKVMCIPENSNAYLGAFIASEYFPLALDPSTEICGSDTTWLNLNTPGIMASGTSSGFWVNATDKFMALNLVVGSDTFYGWARLDFIVGSTSFTVKDYAYESTPDVCIHAGDGILALENTENPQYSIYPNPVISETTIQMIQNLENAILTIYDVYGQSVKQVDHISGNTFSISRDNLPTGLYFIRLTEGNQVVIEEKLIVID